MDKKQILKTVKETPETSVVAALVIMGIILSLLSDVFFTVGNFVNILQLNLLFLFHHLKLIYP